MTTQWRTNTNIVSREFFQVSLVTYLLLTLGEALKEGFVSNFFNMNYLLLVVLLAGLGMVLTEPAESEMKRVVGAATATVARASRAVHAQIVRPAVDTVKVTGRPRVINLRDKDPAPKRPSQQ